MPQHWYNCVRHWHHLNQPHKTNIAGQLVPSQQEEYLLYQTLLGAWPFESPTAAESETFSERIQAYMRKALREAKVHTNWLEPHEAYEEAVMRFVQLLLDESCSGLFLEDFLAVQHGMAQFGMWNSLAQTLLKMTVPGVPDCYQGCELWDLSLVDPDNRRPVDYNQRRRCLTELQQRCQESEQRELVRELLATRHDGRIKLYLIWQTLTFRRVHALVFQEGDYIPLQAVGSKRAHLCAFARRHQDTTVIVVVPRLLTEILPEAQQAPLGQVIWNDTQVVLPEELAGPAWRQLFTGETLLTERSDGQDVLPLALALAEFPVALLHPINLPAATAGRRL
jgi:(1->4)-alpha-D-glucan 1-alpha-D-glucosylmutase